MTAPRPLSYKSHKNLSSPFSPSSSPPSPLFPCIHTWEHYGKSLPISFPIPSIDEQIDKQKMQRIFFAQPPERIGRCWRLLAWFLPVFQIQRGEYFAIILVSRKPSVHALDCRQTDVEFFCNRSVIKALQ